MSIKSAFKLYVIGLSTVPFEFLQNYVINKHIYLMFICTYKTTINKYFILILYPYVLQNVIQGFIVQLSDIMIFCSKHCNILNIVFFFILTVCSNLLFINNVYRMTSTPLCSIAMCKNGNFRFVHTLNVLMPF